MDDRLQDALRDWTDLDDAAYELALVLGILDRDTPGISVKHVFWSNNQLGNALQEMLGVLVKIGAVEHDAAGLKCRWNPHFAWQQVSSRSGLE